MLKQMIGILGTSYCGSTLLSFMMDCMPNVTSVGEVYAKTKEKNRLPEKPYFCTCCRDKGCPYITRDFVMTLRPDNVYRRFAQRFKLGEKDTLLTSDKSYAAYEAAVPHHRLDFPAKGILMFKRPEANIKSFMTHAGLRDNPMDFDEAVKTWTGWYQQCLVTLHRLRMPFVTVQYEDFAKNPGFELKRICDAFDIEYNYDALQYWKYEHHQCGGNTGAHINILGTKFTDGWWWKKQHGSPSTKYYNESYRKEITVDETWRDVLTTEQIENIKKSSAIQRLYKDMCARTKRRTVEVI